MTAFDQAARYLAGLDDDGLEERLFLDPALAAAAAWLADARLGLKQMAALGPVVPVLTRAELERLSATRRVLTVTAPAPAGLKLAAADEFVAGRLPISLGDARWVDVDIGSANGPVHFTVHEAPFDPHANELIVLCSRHVALAAGDIRVTVRDERGAVRGEFVLPALSAAP